MQNQGAAFAAGATQQPQQSLQDLMLVLLLSPHACWACDRRRIASLASRAEPVTDRQRHCTCCIHCAIIVQVLSQARLKPQDQHPS